MAKRFVDTELWQKEWFQDLSLENKVFLKYIFESCDCAGVWNANYRLASFVLGGKYSIENINQINSKKMQFDFLPNGDVFVIDFIKFQYGTLSENCKPHKPIIEKLKKYNLLERVSKGYPKGIQTLEEKEQEQYKEKEKEKEKERMILGTYLNVNLDKEQYQKLLAMCLGENLLNELIDSFSSNIEVGKERPYQADLPNAHYERLKSYYNYRRKNPNSFLNKESKQDIWEKLAEKYKDNEL